MKNSYNCLFFESLLVFFCTQPILFQLDEYSTYHSHLHFCASCVNRNRVEIFYLVTASYKSLTPVLSEMLIIWNMNSKMSSSASSSHREEGIIEFAPHYHTLTETGKSHFTRV